MTMIFVFSLLVVLGSVGAFYLVSWLDRDTKATNAD
jgi:hypothetical protein